MTWNRDHISYTIIWGAFEIAIKLLIHIHMTSLAVRHCHIYTCTIMLHVWSICAQFVWGTWQPHSWEPSRTCTICMYGVHSRERVVRCFLFRKEKSFGKLSPHPNAKPLRLFWTGSGLDVPTLHSIRHLHSSVRSVWPASGSSESSTNYNRESVSVQFSRSAFATSYSLLLSLPPPRSVSHTPSASTTHHITISMVDCFVAATYQPESRNHMVFFSVFVCMTAECTFIHTHIHTLAPTHTHTVTKRNTNYMHIIWATGCTVRALYRSYN